MAVAEVVPLPGVSFGRNEGLDYLRGWAVLLMVADHVLVVLDPTSLARLTVTRLSLPLFLLVAGALWRSGSLLTGRRRHLYIAAVVVVPVEILVGIGQPGILTVIVIGLLILEADPPPLWSVVVGLLVASYLPMPSWWTGYHPAEVVAWLSLGRLASDHLRALPGLRTLVPIIASVGRAPLRWYVTHLGVLGLFVLIR